jgi:hypothetical protein
MPTLVADRRLREVSKYRLLSFAPGPSETPAQVKAISCAEGWGVSPCARFRASRHRRPSTPDIFFHQQTPSAALGNRRVRGVITEPPRACRLDTHRPDR